MLRRRRDDQIGRGETRPGGDRFAAAPPLHESGHLPPSTSNCVLKPLHRPSTMATPLHVHPHFAPEEAAAVAAEFVSSEHTISA